MKKVLIVDSNNLFIRNYVINPSLDDNGNPIGGCKGFLQSLQKMFREINPDQVILVWDGPGGSRKRRSLFSEYKEGRRPLKHNNSIMVQLDESEQQQNRKVQTLRLFEYLNLMPVMQFMFDNLEADDVIAKLSHIEHLKTDMKIIVSSDTDFYQLCSDENRTYLFRPIQKQLLTEQDILAKVGVSSQNFALAKAIAGDKSDNIEGIAGAGFKTISKHLPILKNQEFCSITTLYKEIKNHKNQKLKIIQQLQENKEKIELNYKLIQLYEPRLPMHVLSNIKTTLEEYQPVFSKGKITEMMAHDGFGSYNWNILFGKFRRLFYTKNK